MKKKSLSVVPKGRCEIIKPQYDKGKDNVFTEITILTTAEINYYRSQGFKVEVLTRYSPPTENKQERIRSIRSNNHIISHRAKARKHFGKKTSPIISNHNVASDNVRYKYHAHFSKKQLEDRLVVLVTRLIEDAKEVDFIRKELAKWNDDEEYLSLDSGLFKPYVDENKFAICLRDIYDYFFGPLSTNKLLGCYHKDIDLAAYLYILVEKEKLGNETFSEKGKKPFFDFLINKANITFSMTRRSYSDRIAITMNDFRRNLLNEPSQSKYNRSCWQQDLFIKDFLQVMAIFHATAFYHELIKKREYMKRQLL